MNKKKFTLLFITYGLLLFSLFLYSFTQIDLNLTLSQASIIQNFQKFFIQIGYFNRPLSTVIFLLLIFILYTLYFILLLLIKEKKITERQIWLLIGLTVGVLLFSYPAFSHDLFNYMFDARIFTTYGLNPYQYKALDFPSDPWIRFMHWTHRTYPYGPLFLALSFIPSFLGFGKFVLTLFNFKLFTVASFLSSVILIDRIMKKINPKGKLLAISFFSFNPLIIIEVLVNGHNDIFMLFFLLVSIYFLIKGKNIYSLFFLLASAGIKFATIVFLPLYFLVFLYKRVNWQVIFKTMILLFLLALIPVIYQREPYPWYFIPLLGIVSLTVESVFITLLSFGFSLGMLLRYAPFLYFGDYKEPVPTLTFWLTVIPIFLSIAAWFLNQTKKHDRGILSKNK